MEGGAAKGSTLSGAEAWKRAMSKAFERLIHTTKGGVMFMSVPTKYRVLHQVCKIYKPFLEPTYG